MTLDIPALRKLLTDYREWLSDDNPTRPWDPRLDFQEALLASAGALLRAAEERDALLAACGAKDDLLACYRLGKRPSEALFKRLNKANEAIRLAKETP
jgi:hypothetical protein